MATHDQLKALIRSYFSRESEHFYNISLQIASFEAKQGNGDLANDIREIIDTERKKTGSRIISFPQDLTTIVNTEIPETGIDRIVIDPILNKRIEQIVHEYKEQEKLKSYGLTHRRKVLLSGATGTGKTLTARVIAGELKLPLYTIRVDRMLTKHMEETSEKLLKILDLIPEVHGVYLFDEFNEIGDEKHSSDDIIKERILNSFFQFIEQDNSDSIIICSTNCEKILDKSLFRRFDDVLYYQNPTNEEQKRLITMVIGSFIGENFPWERVLAESNGLNHAEIVLACTDSVKKAILSNSDKINCDELVVMLITRKNIHKKLDI